jgi:FMN phosphatase YigB (HAD superfamily)
MAVLTRFGKPISPNHRLPPVADPHALKAVFFDIGNTLGSLNAAGRLVPFAPGSLELLSVMKGVLGLQIGIITNLPPSLSQDDIERLLDDAGLLRFIDTGALITNKDAGVDKPDPAIYRLAAGRIGVPVDQCLYIGEDAAEVAGARSALMAAILKPFPAQPPA